MSVVDKVLGIATIAMGVGEGEGGGGGVQGGGGREGK